MVAVAAEDLAGLARVRAGTRDRRRVRALRRDVPDRAGVGRAFEPLGLRAHALHGRRARPPAVRAATRVARPARRRHGGRLHDDHRRAPGRDELRGGEALRELVERCLRLVRELDVRVHFPHARHDGLARQIDTGSALWQRHLALSAIAAGRSLRGAGAHLRPDLGGPAETGGPRRPTG